MKLWIDDVRPAPDGWLHVLNSEEAIKALNEHVFEEISFDHDLGGDDTAYRVAEFIEVCAVTGTMQRMKWKVHSANPVGRARIIAAMTSAERFWNMYDALI